MVDKWVIRDNVVDRDFREEVYKMCNVINVRSLGIYNLIAGQKIEILREAQVQVVIKILVNMEVYLLDIMERKLKFIYLVVGQW